MNSPVHNWYEAMMMRFIEHFNTAEREAGTTDEALVPEHSPRVPV